MNGVRAALAAGAATLAAAGIESARLDARVLLAKILGSGSGEVPGLSRDLTPGEQADYDFLIARRAAREPLAYVTGTKEFWSLGFDVGPGALVPRPETETLIEEARREFPDPEAPLRILDLGTGSGCLLVTVLTHFRNATGTGVDISEQALAWARRNAARHGVAPRAAFVSGGWDAGGEGPFDLILSNPPYLAAHEMPVLAPELGHEPRGALESGPEGLEAYRALAPIIARSLASEGRAILELGAGQAESVTTLMEAAGLEILGSAPDLLGIARAMVVRRRR